MRAETHLLHTALEGAAGKGIDRKGRALTLANVADVGFVHIGGNFHAPEIVRDQEQGWRLQARGDRLAEFDIALDDYA